MPGVDGKGGFVRYLQAKRSVDDRAMSRRVWERLRSEARTLAPEMRVIDVGAGIGTGLGRMIEWGLFESFTRVQYLAVEPSPELASHRYPAAPAVETRILPASLDDLEGFAHDSGTGFELVVAHAVLDILELEPGLDRLVALAAPGGLLYFPITFDGETIWEPALDEDDTVMEAYHGTMRRRGRTGRLLVHALEIRGTEILDVACSDWIVRPQDGRYPGDEAFFLRFLLETVRGALDGRVPEPLLRAWVSARRQHLRDGELILIAHQLDVLAKRS